MPARVLSGLDNLATIAPVLRGRRLGLMTGPTGVDHSLRSGIDILHAEYDLSCLLACEHGVRGNLQAGDHVASYLDREAGVPVFSCYGETQRLTPEMLDAFDILLFDMQDVGARSYTYMYSLAYAMQTCASAGKPVVVLDRINPVGGETVQGTLLDARFASFIGLYPMPSRHGLTIGEYALWLRDELSLDLDLTVVPLTGWQREMYAADTDIPWVAPSPNLPTRTSALLFSGMSLFEGTNLSEGRGTTQPFELIGAPWVDGSAWARRMNGYDLPGLRFRAACFTPTFSKHAGEVCEGVQVHVTDARACDPFFAALLMMQTAQALHPADFSLPMRAQAAQMKIELLLGSDALRTGTIDARAIVDAHRPLIDAFQQRTMPYRLYD